MLKKASIVMTYCVATWWAHMDSNIPQIRVLRAPTRLRTSAWRPAEEQAKADCPFENTAFQIHHRDRSQGFSETPYRHAFLRDAKM